MESTIKSEQAERIIAAMPNWAAALTSNVNWQYESDPIEQAKGAIHVIDGCIAPTSETALLGQALDDIETQGVTADVLGWWDTAYEAASLADGEECEEEVYERILSGDEVGALRLARGEDEAA